MLSLGIVVERFCFELGGSGPQGRILVERRNERLDRELTIAWDVLRLNGTRYVRPEVLRRRIAAFEFATRRLAAPGSRSPTSWSRRWAAGSRVCRRSPMSTSSAASCAADRRETGKAPEWSSCPKKVAGDRYAVPDQGECRPTSSFCQSTDGRRPAKGRALKPGARRSPPARTGRRPAPRPRG